MSNRTYALVGRYGDDGGRYLTSQWPQMKARAWAMHRAGESVQVWRASQAGGLERYDSEATQRMTDHIVKTRDALATMGAKS
jgi:hypothetical protein